MDGMAAGGREGKKMDGEGCGGRQGPYDGVMGRLEELHKQG